MQVFEDVYNEYGTVVNDVQLAEMDARGTGVLAYYDSNDNIAVNTAYFNKNMETAYERSVKMGYHPSNGNKTAVQAVVAHELGHKLTQDVSTKLGKGSWSDLDSVASKIVSEARAKTNHKSNASLSKKISGYAKTNSSEAIAEAFADVFCNGNKATSESKAIVDVLNNYLK